jgi:hypothetical protein
MTTISPELDSRIEQALDENKRALSESERRSAERQSTAKRATVVVNNARRRLRRAGLLK